MIRRIQALNYRCLRYVDVSLDYFHVLVGPNASGKSTLLDVLAFLHDLVADGLDAATERRTRNFQDLVWGRPDRDFQFKLAVEFEIPETIRERLPASRQFQIFRYEVRIKEREDRSLLIDSERGLLMPVTEVNGHRDGPFPMTVTLVATHSPTFLRRADPAEVLCFAKDEAGATDVVRGDNHPHMRHSHGKADINFQFSTGVIG